MVILFLAKCATQKEGLLHLEHLEEILQLIQIIEIGLLKPIRKSLMQDILKFGWKKVRTLF